MQKLSVRLIPSLLFCLGMLQSQGNSRASAEDKIFEVNFSCKWRKGSLTQKELTVLGLVIGESTMRDVQKRFPGTNPVKLTGKEEAETGICLKNSEGQAVVFATGVYGAPDTLTRIYLAPAGLVEGQRVVCKLINVASSMLSTKSGIGVGTAATDVGNTLRAHVPYQGQFCIAYEIASDRGPLQVSKNVKSGEFRDSTGVAGKSSQGKIVWLNIFGMASN